MGLLFVFRVLEIWRFRTSIRGHSPPAPRHIILATARMICFIAAGVVIVLGIPPVLIGAVAASTGTPDIFLLAKPFSCPHSGSSASILPFSLCTSFTKKIQTLTTHKTCNVLFTHPNSFHRFYFEFIFYLAKRGFHTR